MSIQDDVKALQNHETFARFIAMIHSLREETIEDLHNATNDNIQQTAGRIISYDQVLQMAGWEDIRDRFRDSI